MVLGREDSKSKPMLNKDDYINQNLPEPTSHEEDHQQHRSLLDRLRFPGFGIACALLCGLFFAVNSVFAKMVSIHPIQSGVSRCYVQFLLLLPIVQYNNKKEDVTGPKNMKIFLWLRGFLGSTSMLFLYLSIGQLSVGNAVTISFLNTMLVPIFARIFLKESLTIVDCAFAVVSLGGVVLIAQPPFLFPTEDGEQQQSVVGVIYALLSALGQSCTFVVIRKLGKQVHFLLNVFYYSFCGSITSTILMFALGVFEYPCAEELPYVFGLGVLGILGQSFLTLALQSERAGTVSVLRTGQIIIVYTMQVVVLGDVPSALCLVGAGLIFSSSLGIGIRKIINERRRRASLRG